MLPYQTFEIKFQIMMNEFNNKLLNVISNVM